MTRNNENINPESATPIEDSEEGTVEESENPENFAINSAEDVIGPDGNRVERENTEITEENESSNQEQLEASTAELFERCDSEGEGCVEGFVALGEKAVEEYKGFVKRKKELEVKLAEDKLSDNELLELEKASKRINYLKRSGINFEEKNSRGRTPEETEEIKKKKKEDIGREIYRRRNILIEAIPESENEMESLRERLREGSDNNQEPIIKSQLFVAERKYSRMLRCRSEGNLLDFVDFNESERDKQRELEREIKREENRLREAERLIDGGAEDGFSIEGEDGVVNNYESLKVTGEQIDQAKKEMKEDFDSRKKVELGRVSRVGLGGWFAVGYLLLLNGVGRMGRLLHRLITGKDLPVIEKPKGKEGEKKDKK